MGFFSKIAILVIGFLYPSFKTFKALQSRNPFGWHEILEYLIVISAYVLFESICDYIFFWIPFYSTIKVLTVIWISCLGGSTFLYHHYIQPFFIEYESIIDGNLRQSKTIFQSYSHSLGIQLLNWIQWTLVKQMESSNKAPSVTLLELEKLPPLPHLSPRSHRRVAKQSSNTTIRNSITKRPRSSSASPSFSYLNTNTRPSFLILVGNTNPYSNLKTIHLDKHHLLPLIKNSHKRPKYVQTRLDFGQKPKGIETCETCQMTFHSGQDKDLQLHEYFHKNYLNGISWNGKHELEKQILSFPNGDGIFLISDASKTNTHLEKKISEIIHRIDLDLGSSGNLSQDWKKLGFRVYLYVSHTHYIQGCLLVEPLQHAYKVTQDLHGQCCGSVLILMEPQSVVCGINRIWVNKPNRRNGIAKKLLNALLNFYNFGEKLQPSDVAFSQPSEYGKYLAESFNGCTDFKVYS